ncbi:uncharacterized protein GIQ15_04430 [Arthroderma uncinatum]|uniref:uncharacterized protein n=1 Tax=Arthroderma uncinatum TaxID=74035 RepID=UPI00144A70E9|nr:uncharacterized protein GIQ15_04430 [Arthroderma uncinatum]KAF3481671.1 hypothetical protein GIQ15_04430 [Arthroderma uncinatum]
MSNEIHLRLPTRLSPSTPTTPTPPTAADATPADSSGLSSTIPLLGTWYVLSSSVDYWRDKRNVSISYALASDPAQSKEINSANVDFTKDFALKSVASYQSISGEDCEKVDTIDGTDRPIPNSPPGTITWRGTGFIKFLSNRWEILGYGNVPGESGELKREGDDQAMWMLIFADKSMLAASSLNLQTKGTKALSARNMELIKKALRDLDNKELQECSEKMVDILQE